MKIKAWGAAALAAVMALALTGCQLARPDGGKAPGGDRLVGVFITKEHLDLFDMEAYLNDNINKLNGGQITVEGGSAYQGRLYASLVPRTLTDVDTGETSETREYVFEGVEGIAYFGATVPTNETEDSFVTSSSDEALSDGHMGLTYGDEEDSMSLEATIYVLPDQLADALYINPVYQSADGRVYATTGSGFSVSGAEDEGSVYSQTLDETTTITENGKSKTVKTTIKISIATALAPQRIAVLQMGEAGELLSREEYTPGRLPGTLEPQKGTAYLVVETHKQNRQGEPLVTRNLVDQTSESLDTFYARPDGVCVKQYTQLAWAK